jgi:pantetheine-phosphate adenylyltransferase
MRRAIYPGTFDPVTIGHLDIINKGAKLFDELVVAVAASEQKKPMFALEQRHAMLERATNHIPNLKIVHFSNLLVDLANEHDATYFIRGLRAVSDFEYELQMGYANASLDKKIETIYLMPSLENSFISSSIVRAILAHKGDASHLLHPTTVKFIGA